MRDLGTPVYPQSFFESIIKHFPSEASIHVVTIEGKPVAAGFLLAHRDRVEIPWASSLREYNRISVNMLLYWDILKTAILREYKVFDFGRSSKDVGTYRFKKQWGANELQLYWHYWLRQGETLPELNPANPKFQLAIHIWRKLPLAVANRLGPTTKIIPVNREL